MANPTSVARVPGSGAIDMHDLEEAVNASAGPPYSNIEIGGEGPTHYINWLFAELSSYTTAASDNWDMNSARNLPQDEWDITAGFDTAYGDLYGYDKAWLSGPGTVGSVTNGTCTLTSPDSSLYNWSWIRDGFAPSSPTYVLSYGTSGSPSAPSPRNSGWEIIAWTEPPSESVIVDKKRSAATFTPGPSVGYDISAWQWAAPGSSPWSTNDTISLIIY